MKYDLCKEVMTNEKIRASFNELSVRTFGLSFEQWYQSGYWSIANMPYSLLDGNKVIANVSVNKHYILFDEKRYIYIQLGTVMTDENYRNQGLSRLLMEEIKKDWESKCEAIFLFANKNVVNFYPKFNFEREEQYQYSTKIVAKPASIRKLNMQAATDRKVLQDYYCLSNPFSRIQVLDNYGLLMFYCTSFFKNFVYYVPEYDAVAIACQDGDILNCFDVFCEKERNIKDILASIATHDTSKVVLGFTPRDYEAFETEMVNSEEDNLFVLKSKGNIFKTNKVYFPEISRT